MRNFSDSLQRSSRVKGLPQLFFLSTCLWSSWLATSSSPYAKAGSPYQTSRAISNMEVKAYSSFLQSIILLFVVGWYAQLAAKWDRVTLFTCATLFCISNRVILRALQPNLIFGGLALMGLVHCCHPSSMFESLPSAKQFMQKLMQTIPQTRTLPRNPALGAVPNLFCSASFYCWQHWSLRPSLTSNSRLSPLK